MARWGSVALDLDVAAELIGQRFHVFIDHHLGEVFKFGFWNPVQPCQSKARETMQTVYDVVGMKEDESLATEVDRFLKFYRVGHCSAAVCRSILDKAEDATAMQVDMKAVQTDLRQWGLTPCDFHPVLKEEFLSKLRML